jgi:putative SOS response-associated peptidase YedK
MTGRRMAQRSEIRRERAGSVCIATPGSLLISDEPHSQLHRPFCGSVMQLTANGRDVLNHHWLVPPRGAAAPKIRRRAPVTNIRNTSSPHWRGWLKPENGCLVPFNSFAEYAPDANPRPRKRMIRHADILRAKELWHWVPLNAVPSNVEVLIMDGIIYLVGLIVIIMAVLSFFGLR